ncbi:hypothetical protein DMENIID0001_013770 [Sergentomyia squamirostris]
MHLSIVAVSVTLVLTSAHGSLLRSPIIEIPKLPTSDFIDRIDRIPIVSESLNINSNVLLRIANAIARNGRVIFDAEGNVVGELSKVLFDGVKLIAKIALGTNEAVCVSALGLLDGGQDLVEKILAAPRENINNPLIDRVLALTDPITDLLLKAVNAIVENGGKILDAEGKLIAEVAEVLVYGGRLVARLLTDSNTAVCVSALELIEGGPALLRAIAAATKEPIEVPAA